MAIEIHPAVVLRATRQLPGIPLRRPLHENPLGGAYHGLADRAGLLVDKALQFRQPGMLDVGRCVIR